MSAQKSPAAKTEVFKSIFNLIATGQPEDREFRKDIMSLMISNQMYLPEILSKASTLKPEKWETVIYNILAMTGHPLETATLSEENKAFVRAKTKAKSLKVDTNVQMEWQILFEKMRTEIGGHQETAARTQPQSKEIPATA